MNILVQSGVRGIYLSLRNVYRFRTPSPDMAKAWVQYLSYAVRGLNVQSLPDDLIDLKT